MLVGLQSKGVSKERNISSYTPKILNIHSKIQITTELLKATLKIIFLPSCKPLEKNCLYCYWEHLEIFKLFWMFQRGAFTEISAARSKTFQQRFIYRISYQVIKVMLRHRATQIANKLVDLVYNKNKTILFFWHRYFVYYSNVFLWNALLILLG